MAFTSETQLLIEYSVAGGESKSATSWDHLSYLYVAISVLFTVVLERGGDMAKNIPFCLCVF